MEDALLQVSDALASAGPVGTLPPLRELYHRVEDDCASVPERAGLLIHLDEMVNAVDTSAELLDRAQSGSGA
jgi:hypothetical protein